jgi:hypothetical protein
VVGASGSEEGSIRVGSGSVFGGEIPNLRHVSSADSVSIGSLKLGMK